MRGPSGHDSQEVAELREQKKLLRQLIEAVERQDHTPQVNLIAPDQRSKVMREVKERQRRGAL
jgi:hypothetical protein